MFDSDIKIYFLKQNFHLRMIQHVLSNVDSFLFACFSVDNCRGAKTSRCCCTSDQRNGCSSDR